MHVIDTSQKKAALFFSKHNKNKVYFNMYIEIVDLETCYKGYFRSVHPVWNYN